MSIGKKTWYVIGGMALVLILLAIGLSRGGRASMPVKALENLWEEENLAAEAELAINLPPFLDGQQRPFTRITIDLNGDIAKAESRAPEFSGSLRLEAAGRGNTFFADGQARVLSDRVLFYLDNLPVFLNPSGSLVEKWTETDISLLMMHNPEAVREALGAAFGKLTKTGSEEIDGEKLAHFRGELTAEEEQALEQALRIAASGNHGLNVVARLLIANDLKAFEVWVDEGSKELRRITAHFVKRFENEEGQVQEFDFATLTLNFSDYGKTVAFDVPEAELSVDPAVFGEIFGSSQALDTVDLGGDN